MESNTWSAITGVAHLQNIYINYNIYILHINEIHRSKSKPTSVAREEDLVI